MPLLEYPPVAAPSLSRRTSIESQTSLVSIEPLRDDDGDDIPGGIGSGANKRRPSSSISFERHNFVFTEDMLKMVDDDDSDTEEEDGQEEDSSLEGIPTAEEAPERSDDEDDERLLLPPGPGSFHRSVDLEDIAAAVSVFRRREGVSSVPGSRRGSGATASAASSSSSRRRGGSSGGGGAGGKRNLIDKIQDEIIDKAIRDGKLAPVAGCGNNSQEEGEEEVSASRPVRAGDTRRRSSFTFGSRQRARISFTRPLTRPLSSLSLRSMASGGGGGSNGYATPSPSSRRGSFRSRGGGASSVVRAGPNLQEDIRMALAELGAAASSADAAAGGGGHGSGELLIPQEIYTCNEEDENEEDDSEAEEDAAIARAVLATTGAYPGSGGGVAMTAGAATVVPIEMARPPPRGTRPRRSSLKQPGERKDWS